MGVHTWMIVLVGLESLAEECRPQTTPLMGSRAWFEVVSIGNDLRLSWSVGGLEDAIARTAVSR